eukprot:TRINITY_DN19484_c0_g1_i1.p1 TRINITY_DN19484_c0_g1~~TRINITY_DN19484_c0_g1_i1.p1  ORF type:complete len:557 (+),score=36.22 TRINITY_DN19484_c0_g1_i1:92-1762(+)
MGGYWRRFFIRPRVFRKRTGKTFCRRTSKLSGDDCVPRESSSNTSSDESPELIKEVHDSRQKTETLKTPDIVKRSRLDVTPQQGQREDIGSSCRRSLRKRNERQSMDDLQSERKKPKSQGSWNDFLSCTVKAEFVTSDSLLNPLYPVEPYLGLLPRLPDDVALQCLARVPWKQRMAAKAVSKGWRTALNSPAMSRVIKAAGTGEHYLCVCYLTQPVASATIRLGLSVRLFNPVSRHWTTLPWLQLWDGKTPRGRDLLTDFECVGDSAQQHLYILGGRKNSSLWVTQRGDEEFAEVRAFDARLGVWKNMPSLKRPRSEFVAGACGNKLYVMDGADNEPPEILSLSEAETNNDPPPVEAWRVIADARPCTQRDVQGSFVLHKKFYIAYADMEHYYPEGTLVDVFDMASESWETQHLCRPPDTIFRNCGRSLTVAGMGDGTAVYGCFYISPEGPLEPVVSVEIRRLVSLATCKWTPVTRYTFPTGMEVLNTVQLQSVGPSHLAVIVTGGCLKSGLRSCLSILNLGKSGGANVRWEFENMPIVLGGGEPCCVVTATSLTL